MLHCDKLVLLVNKVAIYINKMLVLRECFIQAAVQKVLEDNNLFIKPILQNYYGDTQILGSVCSFASRGVDWGGQVYQSLKVPLLICQLP